MEFIFVSQIRVSKEKILQSPFTNEKNKNKANILKNVQALR